MRTIVVLLQQAPDEPHAAMRVLAPAVGEWPPARHPVWRDAAAAAADDPPSDRSAADVAPTYVTDPGRRNGMPSPLMPDALTDAEKRVLRYLPTNLSTREIAAELSCSINTVKTHIRHVYIKLGANSRTEAVKQARALGMLAPVPSGPERR